MAVLMLGAAMATLDTAIANTALPTLATDLNASAGSAIWVINAYQLAMVATLLPFAAYGDIVGHRRVYLSGLALFVLGSVACGCASSLSLLIAARAVQGIGAAGVMSVTSALIRFIYPARQLGRAQGYNALNAAVFFAVGPTIASGILSVARWPWLFWINLPFGLMALSFASGALPSGQSRKNGNPFDGIAASLLGLTFSLLILALGDAAHRAGSFKVGVELVGSMLCFGLLQIRQWGHHAPLLPIDLFRKKVFTLSVLTSVFSYAAQGLAFVSLPFLFEVVMGKSQIETGVLLTPWPICVALAAPIAGFLSERKSVAVLGGTGLLILCGGMVWAGNMPGNASDFAIALRLAVCGAGFGFFQSPNLKALMSSAPPERSGAASGMIPTARLLGQALGATLVAACFTFIGDSGAVVALWIGAAFAGVASLISFMRRF